MKGTFLALVAILAACFQGHTALLSGPIQYQGHSYYLTTATSWQSAQSEAVSLGGHLATINDADEQSWVFGTFGNYDNVSRSLWIGLNDAATEGTFVWASGDTSAYQNWCCGQPDNAFGDEDYVHMLNSANSFGHPGGLWNDLQSPNSIFTTFEPIHGVIEVVPEPSTLAIITTVGALACTALLKRRK